MKLSQKQFASECGVSPVAINKAIKEGRVIATDKTNPTGKITGKLIDTEHRVNIEYYNCQLARGKSGKPKASKPIKKKVVKPTPAKSEDESTPDPDEIEAADLSSAEPDDTEPEPIPQELIDLIESGQLDINTIARMQKVDIDKIKSYHQIQKLKVDTAKARDELINKKLIRSVFSKLYEIDMSQFLTLKDKLIPDLSGIAGVNEEATKLQMGERMDEELWKVLKNVKREMNKFLMKIGDDKIK